MIVIGLTGSVGMGKSTTASLFAKQGIPVFDSDATVHQLYAGTAVAPVEDAFPGVTCDGIIDREALARRVIGDSDAMTRLERIVHPLVRAEREAFLASARGKGATMVVLDVPLLFETGSDHDVDVVVLASAPEAVQKARVLARPGMTEARFAGILVKQMSDAEKRRRARFIIDTEHGIDDAARQVRFVIAALEAETTRA